MSKQVNALKIPHSILPENSTRTLKFASFQQAKAALLVKDNSWSSPKDDETLPTTKAQRDDYVLRLVLAFENVEDVKNKRNSVSVWENLHENVSEEVIEKICHNVVVRITFPSRFSANDSSILLNAFTPRESTRSPSTMRTRSGKLQRQRTGSSKSAWCT